MAVTHGHGNPRWNRDETILALDLYFTLDGVIPPTDDPRVQELSTVLRALPYHSAAARRPSFRNPDGVVFKLQNLRYVATGKGLDSTSKTDEAVWQDFGTDRTKTQSTAQLIRAAIPTAAAESTDDNEEGFEFREGRVLTILHRRRERDPRVRKRLLQIRRGAGTLRCDICETKPVVYDPELEDAIFEAHHMAGLSASGERVTRMQDVALLCANCHRVLHRAITVKGRWVTIEEARDDYTRQSAQKLAHQKNAS